MRPVQPDRVYGFVIATENRQTWKTPAIVLVAGCLISAVGFGARSGMGLFLDPMTVELGWNRETYALAMALQNIAWGICLPIAGAAVDRYGSVWVIAGGAVIYALGFWGMAISDTGGMLYLTGGVLSGAGIACTSFTLAIAAMVRAVGPERRSLVMGLGTAAGSVGQIVFSPFAQGMIGQFGWSNGLLIMGACTLCIIPLALLLPNRPTLDEPDTIDLTLKAALGEAFRHRGYVLLTVGFFVCGFHVSFIMIHLPAYVADLGLSGNVAAWCLALIGVFNIIGSIAVGLYGQRHSNSNGLSFIYAARALVITALLLLPKTEFTLYLFACAMGLLWLSTVPLTTGVVTRIFGVRYMATLFSVVFLSHQWGGFIGVWLGGYLHDLTGTYDTVWRAAIILAIVAAVLHAPINEKPLRRAVRTVG